MIQQNDLVLLIDYTTWADDVVLNAARKLSAEQLNAKQALGFGTIFETLVHIMAAQLTWLSRWKGNSPATMVSAVTYSGLDHLAADWDHVHADLRNFAESLGPDSLHEPVTYTTTRGETFSEPLLWLMMQVINHSTDHRAQLSAMCALAGREVEPLDLIFYLRNKQRADS